MAEWRAFLLVVHLLSTMMKRQLWIATFLALVWLTAWGCEPMPPNEKESGQIARNYVLNDATFKFDGIADSLKLIATNSLDTPYSWEFLYQFTSAHSGYGDRTGQILLQVLTDHRAKIRVVKGKVTAAIIDDRWDMMQQAMLK